MRFLKLRLVTNKPIVVSIPTNPSRIVVTDGFHITQPLELKYSTAQTFYFKVVCGIENDQLFIGGIIMGLIYMMGATSGIIFLQIVSIIPVLYFLFLYYIKRKEFIQIKPA